MKEKSLIVIVILVSILIACDSKTEKKKGTSKSNIMENQVRTYEQSQGVEETLREAEQKRKKTMENQGI